MLPVPAVWHPALVHFPIAFLMLAGPVALVWAVGGGAFWRRAALGLLVLGTAGTVAARQTGETLEHDVEGEPRVERFLDAHEQAADWTLWLGLGAVAVVGLAEGLARRARPDRGPRANAALRAAGAGLAVLASVAVVRTGHLGGLMTWGEAVTSEAAAPPGTGTSGETGTSDDGDASDEAR